ncbi:DUF4129 domain-containing protein [Flavobacterium sp. 3HN19-14]|uniref:DUF4129 domain-containing protein n=1 Tax=Flavobacterium sp. 3HN19-14 TaxID=3448133 RepID=UPI003EE2A698
MSKFFYIFLFFCYTNIFAQDTTFVDTTKVMTSNETVKGKKWKETDIVIDRNDSIENAHFSPKFKEKYKSDDFVYEEKLKQKNAWQRFLEWLKNLLASLFSTGGESTMTVIGWIFTILAIAIIIFMIYLIVKAILNKEGKWVFGRNSDKKIIRYDDIEKNLHLVDFEKLIKETLQSGEKRLTIRYYYLWLLKIFSEKEIIEWDVEKTNSDYLYEIKNAKLKHNFGYLSHIYNYIWYGEFEVDDATFEKTRAIFEQTIKSV